MRLIDKDKLLEFPIRADHCDKEHANEHFIYGIETVMEYVENLPTVDAVPVVRCGECKYYGSHMKGSNIKFCFQHLNSVFAMPVDGFCSYGEKKEGAD